MIRQFEMKDLNAVMDIWLRTTIEGHPFIEPTYFLERYQAFQQDHLLKSQSQVYEIDGQVVGFVSIKQDMVITTINVDKPYRKSGIGEQLMRHMMNKFHQVTVKCFLDNSDALAFFHKLGFEVVGSEKEQELQKEIVVLHYDDSKEELRS